MTELPSDDRLERLLRDLPAPEPSPAFLMHTHRRFRSAMAARARREALAGLMAALLGLAVLGGVLTTFFEPGALVAWLAEMTADVMRWTTGTAVVLSLVPLTAWALAATGSLGSLLSLALLARARPTEAAK
jgi:hypothetical protein